MQPITIEQLVAFVTIMGVIGVAWYRIEQRAARNRDHIDTVVTEIHGRINRLREELNEHRLHVSQHHVSQDTLRATEERLIRAIEKLEHSLEKAVSRVEALAATVAQNLSRGHEEHKK